MTESFRLDKRLAQDCFELGEFDLCKVLLMNDSQYPWFILVPKIERASELVDLDQSQQLTFLSESNLLSHFILQQFQPDKLNIAALGNQVKQLHIHHIGRFHTDPAWPKPVWNVLPSVAYDKATLRTIKQQFETMCLTRSRT